MAGVIGLLGFDRPWLERGVIAFFGVRGIGSFYYHAHGLNGAAFAGAELVRAIVGAVVLTSEVPGQARAPTLFQLGRNAIVVVRRKFEQIAIYVGKVDGIRKAMIDHILGSDWLVLTVRQVKRF